MNTKIGKEYRESILDPNKGQGKFLAENYSENQIIEKYDQLNANQTFIVNNTIDLIEKNEPFFVNVQGEGGSGKSFIIHYIHVYRFGNLTQS